MARSPARNRHRPDAVVGVVVDRLDVERGEELLLGRVETTGAEVRPGQRLADRPLAGLEVARAAPTRSPRHATLSAARSRLPS